MSPIETKRTIVRCYTIEDAYLLKDAIDSSLSNLQKRLPRSLQEPETIQKKEERLGKYIKNFDDFNLDFCYGIFSKDDSMQLGAIGVHHRVGPNTVEIGYRIRNSHLGKGYMTEVVEALIPIIFENLSISEIQIHTWVDNTISAKIPKKLGFTKSEDLINKDDGKDHIVWSLLRT